MSPHLFVNGRCAGLILLLLPIFASCGSTQEQTVLMPQTITAPVDTAQVQPQPAPADERPDLVELTPRAREEQVDEDDGTTIVVAGSLKDGTSGDDPRSALLRASERERSRRSRSETPVAVINDENLASMAEGARVTMGTAPEVDQETEDAIKLSEEMKEQEIYWRTRAREVRQEWRDAYDSIATLQGQAEDLRTRFFAEDDPVRRDREIKPAWDRTLDRLDEARRSVDRAKEKLAQIQDEGRRAGALPGWLREGTEIQPPEIEDEGIKEADPAEPKVIKN
ncbi:MAG: hypothetical protein AAGK22_16160 [Acidobacteriota bacterium]